MQQTQSELHLGMPKGFRKSCLTKENNYDKTNNTKPTRFLQSHYWF